MRCPHCERDQPRNAWICPDCEQRIDGGVVFVTGISGSGADEKVRDVVKVAEDHGHSVMVHDVGSLMYKHARHDDPGVNWNRILDASPKVLRLLRALAFQEISHEVTAKPDALHLVDLHLSFRWKAFLTRGFEPNIIRSFIPYVRCFINIIEDLPKIQQRLEATDWGKREILELLVWRDEELLLTDIFADICGRVDSFAVANGEPPSLIERLIWHPDLQKVYLSFPITGIKDDEEARHEIELFRDKIREFLVVFDPYACRDYEETYLREEMRALRKEVGETTVDRDFRFIDQADAVVVYYPRKVSSKGVDSEMRHAVDTGKSIFLYSPEDLGGGPFQPPASHVHREKSAFIDFLRRKFEPENEGVAA